MNTVPNNDKTLTKSDIVDDIVESTNMERSKAKRFVDQMFERMRVCLESNKTLKISGFGNFNLRDKKARPGRNPKTGVDVEISKRRVVTFNPGPKLRAAVDSAK